MGVSTTVVFDNELVFWLDVFNLPNIVVKNILSVTCLAVTVDCLNGGGFVAFT